MDLQPNVENGAQVKIIIEDLVYYSTIIDNSFEFVAPLNDFKKISEGFHKVIASVTNSWKNLKYNRKRNINR